MQGAADGELWIYDLNGCGKETDINVKAIELIDLYLNGDIDLYIELSGKRGKRSFPYSPLPQAYNPLDDLLRLLEDGQGKDAFKDIDNLAKKSWDSNSIGELQSLVFSAVKDTYYTRVDDGKQVRYIPNELIEKSLTTFATKNVSPLEALVFLLPSAMTSA